MKHARWAFLFAAVAALFACKPFVAPTGDAGSDATTDDTRDAGAEKTSEPPGTDGADASIDEPPTGALDSHPDGMSDSVAAERSADATVDTSVAEAGCDATGTCKKSDGDLCLTDSECSTGTCGGRCCAAGCTCTQPSPANLLKNPGIDRDTSGWTISSGTLTHSLFDAERCPYSGSLSIIIPAGDGLSLEQCVRNTPLRGDFNFGAKVQVTGGPKASIPACQIIFFSGFNCDADQIAANETDSTQFREGWQDLGASVSMVAGANSAVLRCALLGDPGIGTTFNLDMLYVSHAPNRY